MKRKKWFCLFLSVILLLTGCGGKETELGGSEAVSDELYDLELSEEIIGLFLQEGEFFLGAQYYNGERVWFLGNGERQVFCYHEESGERELFLADIPAAYVGYTLYRDEEHVYAFNGSALAVLDLNGEALYTMQTEGRVQSVCMSKEGSIVLAVRDANQYGTVLQTLNPSDGTLSGGYALSDCMGIEQGVERGVMVMDSLGIYDLDMEIGKKIWHMKWNGTSYIPNMGDRFRLAFAITEDGRLEQLQRDDMNFYVVSLRKISIDEMGKIPLVYRVLFANSGQKQLVAKFNQESKEYHVFLQDRAGEDYEDFLARTDMEIAIGKGPDMFAADAVSDIHALAEKGALYNLEDYLTQSGISRENYYLAAFQNLGRTDGIYSIVYEMRLFTMYIKEELLGDKTPPALESLLDGMENHGEQMVFNSQYNYSSNELLYYFFQMSEDFYGMVDWDQKTCDFSGELWEKIMRVAKLYGATERNRGWEQAATPVFGGRIQNYAWADRGAAQEGMVLAGYPAEGGMTHWLQTENISVNAASENKGGAWQFIEFLLREENQMLTEKDSFLPVHKEVLQQFIDRAPLNPYNKDPYTQEYIYVTEEQIEKFWECLANAKTVPYRTEKILGIIGEEAELYFTGDKTVEEISAVIENRVKLYLAEMG